eukprot:SAG22_NODE_1117_length_5518_cov_6.763610_5_plen_226_part_00
MLLNNTLGMDNATCVPCDELCYNHMGIHGSRADPPVDSKDDETWCLECTEFGIRMDTVQVKPGWWRSDPMSLYVYQCNSGGAEDEQHCLGWRANGTGPPIALADLPPAPGTTPGRRRRMAAAAPNSNSSEDASFYDDHGFVDQCREGHSGALCTTCMVNYALDPKTGSCTECESAEFSMFLVAVGTVLFLYYIIRSSINSAEDEDRISTMLFKVSAICKLGSRQA